MPGTLCVMSITRVHYTDRTSEKYQEDPDDQSPNLEIFRWVQVNRSQR